MISEQISSSGQVMAKVRCQRMGCDAFFSEDDNPEGSCRYHDAPLFHDGMKEWSCCKQRSHDFTLFLEIPGCKTGRHTTEKPVLPPKAAAVPKNSSSSSPSVITASATNKSAKETCSRCRQGFFCSDHGSQVKDLDANSVNASEPAQMEINKDGSAPAKKIIDINQPQTCKNKGCGQTFRERDNHETACSYHPGPAIFHDRIKEWKCCDVHVKEFDEFMTIPPCTKGWHNADTTP